MKEWAPGQSPFRIFDKYENESFLFSLNGRNAQPHPTTLISLPINRSNGQSDLRSKEGVGSGWTGLFKISLSIACMTGRFRNPIFAPDREMGNFWIRYRGGSFHLSAILNGETAEPIMYFRRKETLFAGRLLCVLTLFSPFQPQGIGRARKRSWQRKRAINRADVNRVLLKCGFAWRRDAKPWTFYLTKKKPFSPFNPFANFGPASIQTALDILPLIWKGLCLHGLTR